MRIQTTLLGLAAIGLGGIGCGGASPSTGTFLTDSNGGGEADSDGGGSEGETPDSGDTADGDDSGDADTGEDDGEGDDGAPILDTSPPDGGSLGCKVDFLFVIDNSVSMKDNQAALLTSFPGFMDAIESTLDASDDHHIMVVDTDADTRCSPEGCANPDGFATDLCIGPQNGNACMLELEECDITRGAGVVHPVGGNASNEVCEIESGKRYIVMPEDDLSATFSCIAQVGEAGHPEEKPMDSMVEALSPALNGPQGCNDGFLREDAILVVTFISDDPHYEDTPGPDQWHQAVLDAKGGDEDAVVVLGLIPDAETCGGKGGGGCMGMICMPNDLPGEDGGEHWKEFVDSFGEQGMWAGVCEDDYSPFFEEAIGLIDLSCDLNPTD